MFQKLKNFTPNCHSLEDLVYLYGLSLQAAGAYIGLGVDLPAWLTSAQKDIENEVKRLRRDELAEKLAAARRARASLKTPEEKRAELDAQIADLEKKVG